MIYTSQLKKFLKDKRVKQLITELSPDNTNSFNDNLINKLYNLAIMDDNIILMNDADDMVALISLLLKCFPDLLEHITTIVISMFISYPADELKLPNTITEIEDMAFMSASIKKLTIPESIRHIGCEVFNCMKCNELIYEGTFEQWIKLTNHGYNCAYGDGEPDDIKKLICLKSDPNKNYMDDWLGSME